MRTSCTSFYVVRNDSIVFLQTAREWEPAQAEAERLSGTSVASGW